MSRASAVALLARAPFVHVATTNERGEPLLRALNAAIVDACIVFHGAPAGEKMEAIGREAIVSAEEVVASIPSYFVDPQRACPATTLYRSVQVHGTLDAITSSKTKARALTALLAKHQPEGGFIPIAHDGALYAKMLDSLLVFSVTLERLDGKAKLAQNRTPRERLRIVESLWRRGKRGDAEAAAAIVLANPDMDLPGFLEPFEGLSLQCALHDEQDAEACAVLLDGSYWNDRFTRAEIVAAHVGAAAWVTARADGRIVATARAIADGSKYAWIYDVVVAPAWRKKGVGDRVMRLLLDHPAVRRARYVRLGTRDAMAFYEKMGFVRHASLPQRPYASTDMVLVRSADAGERRAP